jgi:hypothetical protein
MSWLPHYAVGRPSDGARAACHDGRTRSAQGGFIPTNLTASSPVGCACKTKRGTAERWIKEGKQAVAVTQLCCHRLRANEVRWCLSMIAHNLGNLLRRLALPEEIGK